MKLKHLLATMIIPVLLIGCGGDKKIEDQSIQFLNAMSLERDIWENTELHKWFDKEGLNTSEIQNLKDLEEKCYQTFAKDLNCLKTLTAVINDSDEKVDLSGASSLLLPKIEMKSSINKILFFSILSRKNIEELFHESKFNDILDKENLYEKERENFKNLLAECHSVRGQKAVCKRSLKEILENGYLD